MGHAFAVCAYITRQGDINHINDTTIYTLLLLCSQVSVGLDLGVDNELKTLDCFHYFEKIKMSGFLDDNARQIFQK